MATLAEPAKQEGLYVRGRQGWKQKEIDSFLVERYLALLQFLFCYLSPTANSRGKQMGFPWTSKNSRKLGRKELFHSYAHLAKPNQTNQAKKTVPRDSLVKRSQSSGFLSNRPSNSDLLCPADFQKFGRTWNQFLSPLWPLQSLLFTAGLTPALST